MIPDQKKSFRLQLGEQQYLVYSTTGKESSITLKLVDANTYSLNKKKESDKFQFTLTKNNGFLINAGKKILMSEQGRVDQVNSQGVIVGSPAVRMGSYKDGTIWSLTSISEADDNMPVFHIE